MEKITIPYLFTPRSYQREVFDAYKKGFRRIITVWHRKSGKDITALNFLIVRMLERKGVYWHILPTYEQAKKVIWYGINPSAQGDDYEGDDAEGQSMLVHFPPELIWKKNESDLMIQLKSPKGGPGSIYQLIGSDKLETIVGPNPAGVVFSEYSIQFPEAWQQVTQPILTQNKGWAVFNFTPRGRNHAFALWEQAQRNREWWWTSFKTVNDTRRDAPGEDGSPVVSFQEIQRMEQEGVDADYIQQEYYCSFTGAHTGSYYGKVLSSLRERNQIREVPWEPTLPVFTVWDLGVADATAIWFAQCVGRELHLIDYLETRGEGLAYYVGKIRNKPYLYSNHWAPHDIEVRELGSGQSRKETAQVLGIHLRVVPNLPVQDGIDATRNLLQRCFFDRVNCDLGLRCLENYSKDWDKRAGEYKSYPKHDKWSHGADAFRYLSLIADREYSSYIPTISKAETEFDLWEPR